MVSPNPHYTIVFARSARKELEKLEDLAVNPRPHGCRKLRGPNQLWRIRIGDYRVVYELDDIRQTVDTAIVRHSGRVYRDPD
jgi:mRNA interferase RelE/StbE